MIEKLFGCAMVQLGVFVGLMTSGMSFTPAMFFGIAAYSLAAVISWR